MGFRLLYRLKTSIQNQLSYGTNHRTHDPIFDPNRCGLGFHQLHSCPAIAVYLVAIFSPRLRIVTLGLLIHIELIVCEYADELSYSLS